MVSTNSHRACPLPAIGAARLPQYEAETRLRERLIGLGYHEILTIPHVAEERNDLFRPADATAAKLSNPLSEEASVLKSTGRVTMAGVIEWNLNHSQRNRSSVRNWTAAIDLLTASPWNRAF